MCSAAGPAAPDPAAPDPAATGTEDAGTEDAGTGSGRRRGRAGRADGGAAASTKQRLKPNATSENHGMYNECFYDKHRFKNLPNLSLNVPNVQQNVVKNGKIVLTNDESLLDEIHFIMNNGVEDNSIKLQDYIDSYYHIY